MSDDLMSPFGGIDGGDPQVESVPVLVLLAAPDHSPNVGPVATHRDRLEDPPEPLRDRILDDKGYGWFRLGG